MANKAMGIPNATRCLMILIGILAAPVTARAQDGFQGEIDLLEVRLGKDENHVLLDSTFIAGAGPNQLMVKVAGGGDTRTAFDNVEIQALYSRTLSDSVAILGGVRHDFRAGDDLTHGSLAVQAQLAPWLAGEHFFFLSQRGDLTGSGEIVGCWALTSSVKLEPRLALGWSAQDVPREDLASGFTDLEGSVRLRHALGDNLDIYVGVIHERLLGRTRDIAMASGDTSNVTRAVIGAGFTF